MVTLEKNYADILIFQGCLVLINFCQLPVYYIDLNKYDEYN